MKLNHSVARNAGEVLRHELQHIGHHPQFDVECAKSLARFFGFQRSQLKHRNLLLLCRDAQRIRGRARLLRRTEHPGNGVAPPEKGLENSFAKIPLPDDCYSHG